MNFRRPTFTRATATLMAIATIAIPTACGEGDPGAARNAPLIATTSNDWVPAAFKDEAGNYTGYFHDIEQNAFNSAGWNVEWQSPPFEAVIPGLQSGKFDLGGGVDVTAERLKVIDIVSVMSTGYTFITKVSNPDAARSEAGLCGLRIGVVAAQSTIPDLNRISADCGTANRAKLTVSTFSDDSAGLLALQADNIDVRSINTAEGDYYAAHHPEYKTTGPIINEVDCGVAFKKRDPRAQQFADAVNKTIADGTYLKVLERYGAQQTAIKTAEVNPQPRGE